MQSILTWLLRLVGFDTERIPQDADVQLAWTNAPQSWKVFLLLAFTAAIAYGVVFLYRREIETCPRWCKRLLIGIRLLTMLLLLAIFLGPAVAPIQRQVSFPKIAFLRDASQSMNTVDRYLDSETAKAVATATSTSVEGLHNERPSRVDVMKNALGQHGGKFVRELEQLGKLHLSDFSSDVVSVETRPVRQTVKSRSNEVQDANSESKSLPPLVATGQGTDLYRAMSQAILDEHTAAAIIWTDGQHTAKDHGPEQLLALAKQAGDKGVPLFFVGAGDPTLPRNLQISEVYADPQVWRDDPFEIQAVFQASGFDHQTATVTLTERRVLDNGQLAENEEILERREVMIEGGGQKQLVFAHTAHTDGRFAYSVRVDPMENEITEDDNHPDSPAEVKVLGEQARVLLVAGSPTWDYRGLQHLLSREKSINLSCWLQTMDVSRRQDGTTAIDRLPVTREELIAYDVVILVDPNPIEFDAQWLDLLKQFVGEHAGGFLYLAGPKFSGRFLAGDKTVEMRDILPVRFGDVRAMEVESLLGNNSRAWDLGVVAANVDQPIMRFYPEPQRSLELWKKLPGIYWSFPAQQAKPASRTLIEHTDPTLRDVSGSRPLLVTGQYGSGRTVYVGFNGTWRWRQTGDNSEYYKRFWIQMVRYLVEGRTLEGKRRGSIETDGFRYQLGDRVRLVARLKDASFKPLQRDTVMASLKIAGREPSSMELKAIPNQPGHFETTLTARATGQHIVKVELEEDLLKLPLIEVAFNVSIPTVETNEVWLNKPRLIELGRASGGGYFELDQLDALIAAIPDVRRTIDIRGTPVPLWDTRRMLLLLVGLLCTEWAIRKRFKLM